MNKSRFINTVLVVPIFTAFAACSDSSNFGGGSGRNPGRATKTEPGTPSQSHLTKSELISLFAEARKNPVADPESIPEEQLPLMDKFAGDIKDAIVSDFKSKTLRLSGDEADVDLRIFDTPIKHQGSTSLCTSFATVAAMENIIQRKYSKVVDISERHLWSKYADYYVGSAVKSAERNWIVEEDIWPFNSNSPESDTSGRGTVTIDTYSTQIMKLTGIIAELQSKNPVVMSVGITSPMLLRGGVLNRYGTIGKMGHAMLAVGVLFDDKFESEGGGVIILKNSYGVKTGDKGYAYMPLNYCNASAGRRCWGWSVRDAEMKGTQQQTDSQPISLPTQPSQPEVPPPAQVSADDFSVKAVYLGTTSRGNMRFKIKLDGVDNSLGSVKSVTFKIHRSWGDDYTNKSDGGPEGFITEMYSTYARNWRTDGAVVTTKDGQTFNLPGVLINY